MITTAVYDDTFTFGDIYSTVDSCDQLELRLSTLRRQGLLPDDDCTLLKQHVAEVREYLEHLLPVAA